MDEQLLTQREASDILRIPVRTLEQWRHLSRGPAFVKVGHAVRYRVADLLAYIDQNTIRPVAGGGEK